MKMKSSNIIPQEIKEHYTDDKKGNFSGQCFQWKVDITYIKCNKIKVLQ